MTNRLNYPLSLKQKLVMESLLKSCDKITVLAQDLKMNHKTFEAHKRILFKKLGVRSRVELILKLAENPVIEYYPINLDPVLNLMNRKLDIILERLNGRQNSASCI